MAICETNDKQSNRKETVVRALQIIIWHHYFTRSTHWTQSQQFQHQTGIIGKLEDRVYFFQCPFMFSKIWKFLRWPMTSAFLMIFSLNIMIEVLLPLKILLLLLKNKLECYDFIYCYVTPIKQLTFRMIELWKTCFSMTL